LRKLTLIAGDQVTQDGPDKDLDDFGAPHDRGGENGGAGC